VLLLCSTTSYPEGPMRSSSNGSDSILIRVHLQNPIRTRLYTYSVAPRSENNPVTRIERKKKNGSSIACVPTFQVPAHAACEPQNHNCTTERQPTVLGQKIRSIKSGGRAGVQGTVRTDFESLELLKPSIHYQLLVVDAALSVCRPSTASRLATILLVFREKHIGWEQL